MSDAYLRVPNYIHPLSFDDNGVPSVLPINPERITSPAHSRSPSPIAEFNPYGGTDPWAPQPIDAKPTTPPLRVKSKYAVPARSTGASGFIKHARGNSNVTETSVTSSNDSNPIKNNTTQPFVTRQLKKNVSKESLAKSFARFSNVVTGRSLTKKPEISTTSANSPSPPNSGTPPSSRPQSQIGKFQIPQTLEEWEAYNRAVLGPRPAPPSVNNNNTHPARSRAARLSASVASSPRNSPRLSMKELPPPPIVQADWELERAGLTTPARTRSPTPTNEGSLGNASGLVLNSPRLSHVQRSSSAQALPTLANSSLLAPPKPLAITHDIPPQEDIAPRRRTTSLTRPISNDDSTKRPQLTPIITNLSSRRRMSWVGKAPTNNVDIEASSVVVKKGNPASNGQRLKALRRSSRDSDSTSETTPEPRKLQKKRSKDDNRIAGKPYSDIPPGAARPFQTPINPVISRQSSVDESGFDVRRSRRLSISKYFGGSSSDLPGQNVETTQATTKKPIPSSVTSQAQVVEQEPNRRRRFSITQLFGSKNGPATPSPAAGTATTTPAEIQKLGADYNVVDALSFKEADQSPVFANTPSLGMLKSARQSTTDLNSTIPGSVKSRRLSASGLMKMRKPSIEAFRPSPATATTNTNKRNSQVMEDIDSRRFSISDLNTIPRKPVPRVDDWTLISRNYNSVVPGGEVKVSTATILPSPNDRFSTSPALTTPQADTPSKSMPAKMFRKNGKRDSMSADQPQAVDNNEESEDTADSRVSKFLRGHSAGNQQESYLPALSSGSLFDSDWGLLGNNLPSNNGERVPNPVHRGHSSGSSTQLTHSSATGTRWEY